jgi:signal peptidase I
MLRKILKVIQWSLFVFIVFLLISLASPGLPTGRILSTYAIVTGSMEPFVHTGSLTFVGKASPKDLKNGDVIAFTNPRDPKSVILHRIYKIEQMSPSRIFITKGDHNIAPDRWQITQNQIKGKLLFALPYIGYLVIFLKTPFGFGIIIGLPALLLIALNIFKIREGIREEIDKGIAKRVKASSVMNGTISAVLMPILLSSLAIMSITFIHGLNFDSVSISNFSITIPVPTPPPQLSVSAISVSSNPVEVSHVTNLSATFTDNGTETHTASWNWGDGKILPATINETNGSGMATGSHTYLTAGVYTVTLTVINKDNVNVSQTYGYIVVYNPDGGFVTGGGTIISPPGAYVADSTLTGKANFGFVSKYQKGANIPTGSTQFHFNTADFEFASTAYDWLVIGGARAQYKGSGTINGSGNYGFMLTAVDGQLHGDGLDKFRIKIINKTTGAIIYDNQMGADETDTPSTIINSGSIIIHK